MTDRNEQPTVMIVDDTPANLNLLSEILHRHGYRIQQFPSGTMALQAAAKSAPDLILLDIMMPGMDGFEVCRRLKDDHALKDIPVIFISALNGEDNKLQAFSQGGVDYVSKPFNDQEVLARVDTHLRLHRMQTELEEHNRNLDHLVREKVQEISESQLATILALSYITEDRDDDTGMHIERTRGFCELLARSLALRPKLSNVVDSRYIDNLSHAAPLHDIGKVSIPDNILQKPGKLTPEEFGIMKKHTIRGSATLSKVRDRYPGNAFINMGIALTRSHHEKWDGTGYPDGLAEDAIPLCGRIMAVADVYDALRSKRPYKEGFSHEKSCSIIRDGAGQHFDPAIVDAFCTMEPQFEELYNRMTDTG